MSFRRRLLGFLLGSMFVSAAVAARHHNAANTTASLSGIEAVPEAAASPPQAAGLDPPPGSPGTLTKRQQAPSQPARGQKYFHEPGQDSHLSHYDARYFKGFVNYDEHRPALRHLIRSYLTTFRALGVDTWLAHGTLLGWWWNGKIMPWDYDLDVQVSDVTLFYLAKHYNRTTHRYTYRDEATGEDVLKEYLLDINPNHGLPRGDGLNIIDARWIDMSNGMFIDITGLAEREPARRPGVWSCKNFHHYRTRELFPMRETEFEGVPAMIPYSFDKALTDEYGRRALVVTAWEGHKWNGDTKEWEKVNDTMAINAGLGRDEAILAEVKDLSESAIAQRKAQQAQQAQQAQEIMS